MVAFAADAASHLVSVATLLGIRTPPRGVRGPRSRHLPAEPAWVWRQPFLRAATLLAAPWIAARPPCRRS